MTDIEKKREEIDTEIEFVLMAAYHAGKTGESISESIEKCKVHLKKGLHSQGVVIKGDSLGASHPHLVNYFTVESLVD